MATNRSQTILLIAVAMCGGFIVVLSFMNWVEFDGVNALGEPVDSFPLNGTEVSRIQGATTFDHALEHPVGSCTCRRDFGDGYLVAIIGAWVLVSASVGTILRRMASPLMASAVAASLAGFAISGYNATGLWQGAGFVGPLLQVPAELDGEVTFELFTLTAIAALSAVLGAVVLMTTARDAREQAAAEIEAQSAEIEEANGWA